MSALLEAVAIDLAERGLVPDGAIRAGIRSFLGAQLARAQREGAFTPAARAAFRETIAAAPLAVHTDAANRQHYEVPPAFYVPWLGPRMKYSSALWSAGAADLAAAEDAMLALTCERARIADGQDILELGCGWGSLTLWLAERYPAARVTAVTNSAAQAAFIRERAAARGLTPPRVIHADMRDFGVDERFDRVVSVEMFEHLRNWRELLRRVRGWLADDGLLFAHVFSCRDYAYTYETADREAWMARHFFTGGMMPSDDLLASFDEHMVEESRWIVDGRDYARTLEAWLVRLDAARDEATAVLAAGPGGRREAARAFRRWRIFLLACAELFAWDEGRVWHVLHTTLKPRA